MRSRWSVALSPELPAVVLVLGFTAVPTELQPFRDEVFTAIYQPGIDVVDLVANLLLFVPLGIALAHRGTRVAVVVAAALSVLVEIAQLFSTDRTFSLLDVAMNVLGAAIGVWVAKQWLQLPVRIRIDRIRG
jgi:VanZ family protein